MIARSAFRRMADFFLGGPVSQPQSRQREIVLPPFHPIIFANGRDDDTEGLKAFIEGRPVMLFGRQVQAGDAVLEDVTLRLRCLRLEVFDGAGKLRETLGFPFGPAVRVVKDNDWHRMLRRCTLEFGCPVEP